MSLVRSLKLIFLTVAVIFFFSIYGCNKSEPEPALPELSVSAGQTLEGTGNNTEATIDFKLSEKSDQTVSFTFSTKDSTAVAGKDYIAVRNSSVQLNPGETSKSVQVEIVSDSIMEFTELFNIRVSGLENATMVSASSTVEIKDDDAIRVSADTDGYITPDEFAGMKLVWSDEFDYEGLPDSTKWS